MRHPVSVPGPHLLAAALCAGLALAVALRCPGAPLALVAMAFALLALASGTHRAGLLALVLLAAGWWWGSVRLEAIDRSELASEIGGSAVVRAEVTGPPRRSPFTQRVFVRVRRLDRRAVDEPAQLELPARVRAPPQGAVVESVALVRAPRGPDESSSYDEAAYLRRHGIHVVLRSDRYRVVGRRGGIAGGADRIRASLARSIAPGLEGEKRALVAGIVLGEDEGLDATLRDRFRASGLYHLLAVSGQNVAYVVGGVFLAGWLLGVPRWLAQVAAIAAILCYVLAVGWQPSVVRAAVAGGLASLAWLAARPRDRWYFLLVGAGVLLAWSPYNLLDPGFQLSFAAVAAIFLLVPPLERHLVGYPLPRGLGTVVAVSAACSLATAPILWLQFGAVPVLAVVANALAAPVVAPILGLGLGASLVGWLSPEAAATLAWINGSLVAYLAACARFVGGLPFAQVDSWLSLAAFVTLPLALVALRRLPPRRRRTAAGLVAVAAVLILAGWQLRPQPGLPPPPEGLRVSFLDVGQGDAALLQVPEGSILVDQGPPEADVEDRLERLGVRRITALVLTHPQRDHVGGAADVLRHVAVGALLDSGQASESPEEAEALAEARQRGVPIIAARAGQLLRLGRLRLKVLWPEGPGPPGADPNQYAIVLLASFGDVDVLLTADAESSVTAPLALPPVEILKVAHHGSADEGLPALLARLRPGVAVISVGSGNDYGHPTASTLAALGGLPGLRLYRTDLDGTVVAESDGTRIEVRSER